MRRGSWSSISDDKTKFVIRIDGRLLFLDLADAGAPRAAFQCGAELGELLRRADGVGFHAAVRQISRVAVELQALRGALREIAEADPLHISGDEVTPGLFELAHKTVNCSREGKRVEGLWPGNGISIVGCIGNGPGG